MNLRLRPGISEPVVLMFSRRRLEARDTDEPLGFLHGLSADWPAAIESCAPIRLVVDRYNNDPASFVGFQRRAHMSGVSTRNGPTGPLSARKRKNR